MNDLETYDFPKSLLDRASKINLAHLLDSPITQPFAVSMLVTSVSTVYFREGEEFSETDDMLEFNIKKIIGEIPKSEKDELFKMCKTILNRRRDYISQKKAAES